MTNENENQSQNNVTPAFENAAAGDATTKFYKDIVDYSTADAETKTRMDALIASLDVKNLNTITTFGKEPTDVLRESSESIVKAAQTAASFLGGFAKFKELVGNFNFEKVGELARKYTASIQRKLAQVAQGPVRKFFHAIFGKKETDIQEISHEINKSLLQLGDVVANLEEAKEKIPGIVTNLNILEKARINAYSEYGVYVGAALEKYRRTKEEMPALEKAAADSPMKQAELNDARLGMTVLNAKLTDMDTFHKSCLVQLKTINDLEGTLAMSQLKIDSHLTISQGQWTALLAESATAVQIAKIVEDIKAADDFGDKVFEQSQKLSDMTKVMARSSFGHGTLDPVKVVAHLEKRAKDIQEDLKFLDTFNQKMETERAALDEAGRKFREAAIKVTEPKDVSKLTAANANTVTNPVIVPKSQQDGPK
jgi:hypothetical protein